MDNKKQHLVRIHDDAHRELKIISAITRRSMGDLIEEMIFRYKDELTGGEDWGKEAFDLVAKREQAIEHAKGASNRRKERAEYKRQILEIICKLRDEGLTFEEIASRLNTDKYQTLTGKSSWQAGTVNKMYQRHQDDSKFPTVLDLIKKNAPYRGTANGEE